MQSLIDFRKIQSLKLFSNRFNLKGLATDQLVQQDPPTTHHPQLIWFLNFFKLFPR